MRRSQVIVAAWFICFAATSGLAHADESNDTQNIVRVQLTNTTVAKIDVAAAACSLQPVGATQQTRSIDIRAGDVRCSTSDPPTNAVTVVVRIESKRVVVEAEPTGGMTIEEVHAVVDATANELRKLIAARTTTAVTATNTHTTWRQRLGPEIGAGFEGWWAGFGIGAAIGIPVGLVTGLIVASNDKASSGFFGDPKAYDIGGGIVIGAGIGAGLGFLIGTPIFVASAGDQNGGSSSLGWAMFGSFVGGILSFGIFAPVFPVIGAILGYELSSDDGSTRAPTTKTTRDGIHWAPTFDANAHGASIGIAGAF